MASIADETKIKILCWSASVRSRVAREAENRGIFIDTSRRVPQVKLLVYEHMCSLNGPIKHLLDDHKSNSKVDTSMPINLF